MTHPLIEMLFVTTAPKKSHRTNRYKSGKNVWFRIYVCPLCHARVEHLANFHKPTPTCDGSRKPANELIAAKWRSHGWVG